MPLSGTSKNETTDQDDSAHRDFLNRMTQLKLNNSKAKSGPSGLATFHRSYNDENTLSSIENWKSLSVVQDVTKIVLKIKDCEQSVRDFLLKLSTFEEVGVVFDVLKVVVSSGYDHTALSVIKIIFTIDLMEKLTRMFEDDVLVWLARGINQVICVCENIKKCCSAVLKNAQHFWEKDFFATFDGLLLSLVVCLKALNEKIVLLGMESQVNLTGVLADFKQIIMRREKGHEEQPGTRKFSFFPEDLFDSYKSIEPNIVDGPYLSPEHYIETQMYLLKQDFEIKLRAGIALYVDDPKARNFDIWSYNDVRVELGGASNRGNLCKIVLNDKFLSKIEWEKSARFIHGSMVIISSGNFENFHLAIVRDRGNVETGRMVPGRKPFIYVDFPYAPPKFTANIRYKLIEPKAFFEPYHQAMLALSSFLKTGLPMERYLVRVDTKPRLPDYISDSTEFFIENSYVRLSATTGWPDASAMALNESQKSAVMNALTNELVLIQGPPGTGKTYLALKLIKYIVDNNRFSSPILIVCYKNHSLDQLLELLLDRGVELLRIGAQSKSEKLKDFNISRVTTSAVAAIFREMKSNEELTRNNAYELSAPLALVNHLKTKRGIVRLELLEKNKVISSEIYTYFSNVQCDQGLVDWLIDADSYRDDCPLYPTDEEIETAKLMKQNSRAVYAVSLDELINSIEARRLKYNEIVATSKTKSLNRKQRKALIHTTARLEEDLFALSVLQSRLDDFQDVIADKSTVESLLSTPNLNDIPLEDRWKIYNFWESELCGLHEVSFQAAMKTHSNLQERYSELRDMFKIRQVMARRPKVIGITTTSAAAHHRFLQKMAPEVVIVEEAAEVLESHIVASLSKSCKQLILIGDHEQLKPSTASHEMSLHYNMNVSLFERMMKNGARCDVLNVQHRMRPEIAALISPSIYPDLVNHPSVTVYPNVAGVAKNVIFFHHEEFEELASDSESRFNRFEADFALAFASYLLKQEVYKNAPYRISILTTYKEQERYMMKGRDRLGLDLQGVFITAVDNYQGEENDVIILSLVRSNLEGNIGFLATKNRICVALSRAKHGLYILGNMECLVRHKSSFWCEIYDVLLSQDAIVTELPLKCTVHSNITLVKNVEEILALKHGGCNEKCFALFDCGHPCKLKCHGYSLEHKNRSLTCHAPCLRKCPKGHSCTSLCSNECPPCNVLTVKKLPCEHTESVPCSVPPTNEHCQQYVQIKFENCHHEVRILCRNREECKCNEQCGKDLECGHKCTKMCHPDDDPFHENYECTENCTKVNTSCPKQHVCTRKCFEDCGACVKKVTRTLGCAHFVEMACSDDINGVTCNENCLQILELCGHACPNVCSEPCGPCRTDIEFHMPCGHEGKMLCGSNDPAKYMCPEKCTRVKDCGHVCSGKCSDDCNSVKCSVQVEVKIPCGHLIHVECHRVKGLCLESCRQRCAEKCTFVKKCGHACKGLCSEVCSEYCFERCTKVKECGHECLGKCSDDCSQVMCRFTVEVTIQCGHTMKLLCPKVNGGVIDEPGVFIYVNVTPDYLLGQCDGPCGEILPCGHKCQGKCGQCLQGRFHKGCGVVCKKPLRCSHKCEAPCGMLYHSCNRKSCDSACWNPDRLETIKRGRNISNQKRAFNKLNSKLWSYFKKNHAKQNEDESDELEALLHFASVVSVSVASFRMDRKDTVVTLMSHAFLVELINVAKPIMEDACKRVEYESITHFLNYLFDSLRERDIHHLTSTEISQIVTQMSFLKGCLAIGEDFWSDGKSLFELWNEPNFPPKILAESDEIRKALFSMTEKNVVAIIHHRD